MTSVTIPSTCGVTAAVWSGVTMPFASTVYGIDMRRTGVTATETGARGGLAGGLLHAAASSNEALAMVVCATRVARVLQSIKEFCARMLGKGEVREHNRYAQVAGVATLPGLSLARRPCSRDHGPS